VSEFEVLVIPISVLLGVGAARMLEDVVRLIRYRDHAALHWLPFAWAGYVFMYMITFFSVLWVIDRQHLGDWTWPLFGMQLVYALLLFLSSGLILASDEMALRLGMLSNFDRHGRLALLPLAVSFALSIPFNRWVGGPTWVSLPNLLNLLLLASTMFVFRSRAVSSRAAGTLVFGAISAVGWFFIFAGPGS